jgi:hypothetical protein
VVRGLAGGEFGLIGQESALRRMTFVPGAKPAFQIERIASDLGLLGPYSMVEASDKVFFYSSKGFYRYAGGVLTPIGKERIDRTVAAELDVGNLQLLIGAADPSGTRVFWGYKTLSNSAATFDKILCFDDLLDRFAPQTQSGEYLAALVKPGVTLDALDSISSSIDALTFSLDSVAAAVSASLSAFNTDHKLALFDGSNLEAVLETPERALSGRRVFVRGIRPITDATDVRGSIKHRKTQQAAVTTSAETTINSDGLCPARVDNKYARARIRIPAGTSWTLTSGVEPDFVQSGGR